MERRSSCCSGKSYVSAPKKEPLITPKEEYSKPQTISTDKAAEENIAVKKEPVPAAVKAEPTDKAAEENIAVQKEPAAANKEPVKIEK